jgi:hypothetical protein
MDIEIYQGDATNLLAVHATSVSRGDGDVVNQAKAVRTRSERFLWRAHRTEGTAVVTRRAHRAKHFFGITGHDAFDSLDGGASRREGGVKGLRAHRRVAVNRSRWLAG